jgi:plasmid stabilization system protein ParE
MRHRVELSSRAAADIREVHSHIRRHGPADPDAWMAGLDRKLETLELFPEACALAPEGERTSATVRQTFYGPYRILFVVREDVVYVVAVRHGARRFLKGDDLS